MPAGFDRSAAGLCARCVHALLRPTRRGTTYLRCGRSATDARFPKYPPLPVRSCPGFEPELGPDDDRPPG